MFLLVVAVVETLIAAMWVPSYYRSGIVAFRREFPLPPEAPRKLYIQQLALESQGALPPFVAAARIGSGEYALRGCRFVLGLPWFTSMYGHVLMDRRAGVLRVKGRLHWSAVLFPPCFVAYAAALGTGYPMLIALAIGALLLEMVLHLIQCHQFAEIAIGMAQQVSPASADVSQSQAEEGPRGEAT